MMQPRAHPRPVFPNPSQGLVVPGQAQMSRLRSAVHMPNGYAPLVPLADRDYAVAAQPVRQTYPEAVSAPSQGLHAPYLTSVADFSPRSEAFWAAGILIVSKERCMSGVLCC